MKTFKLKKYTKDSIYTEFESELISIEIFPIKEITFILFDEVINTSKSIIQLPKTSLNHLEKLLQEFNLESFTNEFLTLTALTQKNYLLYNDKLDNNLHTDFIDEKKDLIKLLDVINHSFSNKKDLHSISFKYNSNQSKTIKNFFVLDEIHEALAKYYDVNKSNFSKKKDELLKLTNQFNYKKGKDYIKSKVVISIFAFLEKNYPNISENQSLKFCGVFLHICQIPSNNNDPIIETINIKNSLELIDHQNIRHYKNQRFTFFK
ncbi:hypothetical protein F7642_02250 [Tenacibaculum finnmarkense genomovar ulcerans]|uniref:hypothetical protein n=1 Tax=Tenacibaculum finnmarkense TaxID=2781243 RepID=UPI00187BB5CC|nr:hypothetical protein [Tenacibaculum finnmarkense]MBE7633151.1 hypothetical protein [Tenacibaculum finnmarkense genomovar ulcerans]MCD8429069.1 hypothetical protein [Tenacibaculum finnmarkense genomovar ulcerans]